jgi:hypothetical protein
MHLLSKGFHIYRRNLSAKYRIGVILFHTNPGEIVRRKRKKALQGAFPLPKDTTSRAKTKEKAEHPAPHPE